MTQEAHSGVFVPEDEPLTADVLDETVCDCCNQSMLQLVRCECNDSEAMPRLVYDSKTAQLTVVCGGCDGALVEFIVARMPVEGEIALGPGTHN